MSNLATISFRLQAVNCNRKHWVVSAALALFMLAQFAATVHAAEHVFHQEESFCAALDNVDNNKLLSHQVTGLQLTHEIVGYVTPLLSREIKTIVFHSYHSRAPPQLTV